MNEIWGIENTNQIWHWPIAIYLFLAGLSSGALLTALSLKWSNAKSYIAFIKSGILISPIAIIIGLIVLIFDLSNPLNFYQLLFHYNLKSVMSIGVLLLLFYTPICVIYALAIYKEFLQKTFFSFFIKSFKFMFDFLEVKLIYIERILFILGVGVGVYTGFLLSAIESFPVYNSPILPVLFLTSGLSSGIAACIFFGILFFKKDLLEEKSKYLLAADLRVIPIELLLIFALFIGLYFQGKGYIIPIISVNFSFLSCIFWIGVIGCGVVIPSIISITALKNHAYRLNFILLNSFCVMLGVLALRLFILYAGNFYDLN
ncbi:NrfD/PsrC family molybdoenzyme membrane anchor subunit [Campylobacter novaezeelandiae]|uniref:NrfD/PsrC family molybdoenzyme membrane anchor subunit n=2 Tax=Campylobacter novaezeelandiae TaxID=2267891 RepID=UPI0019082608|nr:NrfD/PsrC family molybdoenzyme membrane anchor subunit [Campylobacter novaezeelandiae]MBK1964355.1 polysulfide reductase NrfD [Campylobacter novaezeelandiae]